MARYFRRGKSKIVYVPVVAGASPTRPEITAGTLLTPQIAEVSGFSFSNSPISTPDLDSTFTSTIAGEDTASDSSLTFYDDDASVVLRNLLVKGTAGYIVLFPLGDVPTKRCEVWPVQSTGVADEWSAGNDPARFTVQFGVTAIPKLAAVVPA
jgi:hypothetical protein